MNPTDNSFVQFILRNTREFSEKELIDFCEGRKDDRKLSRWYSWFASYKYQYITEEISKQHATIPQRATRVDINWIKTDKGNAIKKGETLLVTVNEDVLDPNTLAGAILKNSKPVMLDDTRDGSKKGLEFPLKDRNDFTFKVGDEFVLDIRWREHNKGERFQDKFLLIE